MIDAWKEAQKVLRNVSATTYERVIKGLPVDTAMIFIADEEWYKKHGGHFLMKRFKIGMNSAIFGLPNGEYAVKWAIPNTWNGDVNGSGILRVTSGKVTVTDPGYHFHGLSHDQWIKISDRIYDKPVSGVVKLNKMGGDGLWDVYLKITKKS